MVALTPLHPTLRTLRAAKSLFAGERGRYPACMPKRLRPARNDPFAPESPWIMTIVEVAPLLGLTSRLVRKAALVGELPAIVIAGEPYVLREPLRRILYGETPPPDADPGTPSEDPTTNAD
jgi:hypothetical protein